MNQVVAASSSSPRVGISPVGDRVIGELPWIPPSLMSAIQDVADGKVVVPDLELDRQIHALCLLSRVYNRVNSIMFEHVGHGIEHRPACVTVPGEIGAIQVKPLSDTEVREYGEMFQPLIAEMGRLEGEGSMVNVRNIVPGVYTLKEYQSRLQEGSVVLN